MKVLFEESPNCTSFLGALLGHLFGDTFWRPFSYFVSPFFLEGREIKGENLGVLYNTHNKTQGLQSP
jgi:hypothetical protein